MLKRDSEMPNNCYSDCIKPTAQGKRYKLKEHRKNHALPKIVSITYEKG